MGERPEGTEKVADGFTVTNSKLSWLTQKVKCYSKDRRGRLIMNFLSYLGIGLLKEQGIELITCLFLGLSFPLCKLCMQNAPVK